MALQNGTRGAGIAKGGYKPKPFSNEAGKQKVFTYIPTRIFERIRVIADKESVAYAAVLEHAIVEYFKAIDGVDEGGNET